MKWMPSFDMDLCIKIIETTKSNSSAALSQIAYEVLRSPIWITQVLAVESELVCFYNYYAQFHIKAQHPLHSLITMTSSLQASICKTKTISEDEML